MTPREAFEEVGGLSTELPGQLQRHRLLPEAAGARAAGRLRPRHPALPLRVIEPVDRGRRLGEGAADRALEAADRSRPLLQPEPQVRYAAPQLPLQMEMGDRAASRAGRPVERQRRLELRAPLLVPLPRHRPGREDRGLARDRPPRPRPDGRAAEGPRPGRRPRRVHRRGAGEGDLGGRRGQLPGGRPQAGHEGDHLLDHGRRAAARPTSTASSSRTSSSTCPTRRGSPPSSKR